MLADRTTLAQFLIEERRRHPDATGDLNALIFDVALACKAIARRIAYGALGSGLGKPDEHGERAAARADVAARDIFLRANEWGGHLAGMASESTAEPLAIPARFPRGRYLLIFDPLDGLANIDVNLSVGSIFSVLRAPLPGAAPQTADFLQPGSQQVCAGYAIYGPATILVITVGTGVHGFTLDPGLGEFILTRERMRIPETTGEFAINASNSRFWAPAIRRYVDECMAGRTGARGRDFNMRWIASLVAEAHRILTRGGVFLYPRDTDGPARSGRLQLLFEANPIAYIAEQAGGAASTGQQRILEVVPKELHQRTGVVFGAREEVERIEAYFRDPDLREYDAPLFNPRGLFRTPA